MKKETPKLRNQLKLLKENVIFVIVINHKFLLSKRHEEKIFLKKEDVKINIIHLCQTQHGVI